MRAWRLPSRITTSWQPQISLSFCVQIVGVIRQKYIFKTRPKPLITKPGK